MNELKVVYNKSGFVYYDFGLALFFRYCIVTWFFTVENNQRFPIQA